MTSRGIRNSNPGNIRRTRDKWRGLREGQTDPEFFQFTEMRWGYRALLRVLRNYREKHGCLSIKDLISRWAPATENHTGDYIAAVCEKLQVPTTYEPDVNDKDSMCALAAAISEVENGVPAVMADVEAGWELL